MVSGRRGRASRRPQVEVGAPDESLLGGAGAVLVAEVATQTESLARQSGKHQGKGVPLIGVAIVLTGLNLRTAVTSVGPVLEEIQHGLRIPSGLVGLITAIPVLCFAMIGFTGPPLAIRYRDSRVLAGAMLAMAGGLILRSAAHALWLFLFGTALAMVGGALGNVLLPGLVKRFFPARTGLLVGAYSTAMAVGGAVAAVVAAPIAAVAGADGWRWSLGAWAVLSLIATLPWLAIAARRAAARRTDTAIRIRDLVYSRTAIAMAIFFGLLSAQGYVIIGWSPQYLRDMGLSAATAGLLLGINSIVIVPINAVVPALTVRPHLQRPLLLAFVGCYLAGWIGLWVAPTAVPWLWMTVLAVGAGMFAMVLTLMGLRARTPETTAALSSTTQGWGYLLAGAGPLLVGVLRGSTGSYTGMFVLMLISLAGLTVTGWLVTQDRYVDDELPSRSSMRH